MTKLPDNADDLIDAVALADLLGVNISRLQDLRNAGLPTRGLGKAMRYPFRECLKWFISHKIQVEVDRVRAQLQPAGPEMDKEEAVARKLTAEALIKEVELEQLRGTLVNVKDAESELAKHLGIVRNGLLSFPARVAPYLVALKTELDAREMMTGKVNDLMTQLAKQVEEVDVIEEEDNEEDE
jgi:phage terminase Nu1 subunit (DNA packaging protein)